MFIVCSFTTNFPRCAESLALTPNHALKQAIADYVDKRPGLKQLQQIVLDHKSLELALKLREADIARMQQQATPGNATAALSTKSAPDEVKRWLESQHMEQYSQLLVDNGCDL